MTSVLAKSLLSILLGAWLNPVTLPALTLVSTRLAATGCQACVASNKRAEQSSFNTGRLCSWLQQLSLNGYGQKLRLPGKIEPDQVLTRLWGKLFIACNLAANLASITSICFQALRMCMVPQCSKRHSTHAAYLPKRSGWQPDLEGIMWTNMTSTGAHEIGGAKRHI